MSQPKYPGLFDRIKAIIIDSIVLIIFMIIITDIFSSLDNVSDNARIIAFLFIFLLYDPICTSFFGGTIGHNLIGIRIRQENNPEKNILFSVALFRYLVKALLGWISLFSVMNNEKRQAIHDFMAKSVVVYKEQIKEQCTP
ncbi:RDD family protein [Aquimarina sp. 2201CG14-23]|uniref:RDD family protein n=1 Tax=Aquimarina mycalae TaxID=3040073 RepID=UPI0024782AA0|nr:RDD family protein [Aquimarina sp. 2201CG14-23]MDH7445829.1 RDD family protein [Aquimarina sp. 2201CG14-23]